MLLWLAILAAFGCALCNGISAVLQKMSADKEAQATSLQVGLFVRLLQDWPYLLGIGLDGLAWILTLVAVHSLPLFVVQPIIALSVVVTALIEHFVFRRRLAARAVMAIGCIILGLVMITLTATSETASVVVTTARIIIMIVPAGLAILGAIFIRVKEQWATAVLAALSGLAFGGTAVVGRMLRFTPPYWHVVVSWLFLSLVAYGLVGMLLFTAALQRHHASVVNAVMVTFETIAPIIVGVLLLGDRPRHGLWPLVIIGAAVALSGSLFIAAQSTD